jgi:hypothetical protein
VHDFHFMKTKSFSPNFSEVVELKSAKGPCFHKMKSTVSKDELEDIFFKQSCKGSFDIDDSLSKEDMCLTFLTFDLHLNMSGLSIVEGLPCKCSQDVKADVITPMSDATRK